MTSRVAGCELRCWRAREERSTVVALATRCVRPFGTSCIAFIALPFPATLALGSGSDAQLAATGGLRTDRTGSSLRLWFPSNCRLGDVCRVLRLNAASVISGMSYGVKQSVHAFRAYHRVAQGELMSNRMISACPVCFSVFCKDERRAPPCCASL